ncbi:hypothetical protein POVWA2_075820 [Plasmodium ovale wallikeri]|uniref:STP1 protein n=1 Tax=Plasmodium ovale wallikeri TaxID=864142 RepID=A0A1A9AL06_PLAOA|nr:hypothetical protein POVWA2_075820 [Plasmodium ovale wallikeri]
MADDSEITTLTHYIPVDVFLGMITNDIKNVIRTHGHKNCGLRYEDVCEKIQTIITTNKTLISKPMNDNGLDKFNREWRSKKNGFLNKLFNEEGFINMCFPNKKYPNNPILNQLLSRHIKFCKEKDARRAAVEAKHEYNACKEYDTWIETEKASFTREYLRNVSEFRRPIVHKYFSTKEHPGGHDPLGTYRKSKLDCEIYNPKSKRYQAKLAEKVPTKSLHLPTAPDLDQKSQGKSGSSIPGKDGGSEKEKSDVKVTTKAEPPVSDTKTSSLTHTKGDDTANGQHTVLKAEGTDPPSNAQVTIGKPTEATNTKPQSPQQLPESPRSISPNDLPAAKVPDTPPSVTKGQGTSSDSTPSTTLTTSGTTHSNQNQSSSSAPDLSLLQSQPPSVVAVPSQSQISVTAPNSKETTPPDSVGKFTDKDSSLIPALDPGLAPSHAATSNSSASKTLSTTMISTPGSSLDQVSHLPTPSTQSIVTTTIATTITQTTTSASSSPATTVSAMSTKPISSIVEITSTTGESGKLNTPLKTITDSQDPNTASPKNQDDSLQPNKGTNIPDTSSSHTSANSNVNLLPDPYFGPSLLLPPVSSPGLPSDVPPLGSPPVIHPSHAVVTETGKHINYNLFIQ